MFVVVELLLVYVNININTIIKERNCEDGESARIAARCSRRNRKW